MPRADQRAQFGALARHFGVLRAQLSDGLRQHRLRDGAALDARLARADDLVVAGARFRGLAARGVELQRHFAELLVADQHVAGGDELVLLLVLDDAVIGFLHAHAQRIEPPAERRRGATRRARARFGLVVEIGLSDRVRDAHGFLAAFARHIDFGDERLVGALHADALLELAQRLEFGIAALGADAGGREHAAHQARKTGRRPAEFRIGVEALAHDRAAQHGIGGDDEKLALHHRDAAVGGESFRRHLVADDAAVARVDQDLRRGGIERRREEAVGEREEHGNRRDPQDDLAAALHHADQLFQVDARIVGGRLRGGRGAHDAERLVGHPFDFFLQHQFHLAHYETLARKVTRSSQVNDQRGGEPSFAALTTRR